MFLRSDPKKRSAGRLIILAAVVAASVGSYLFTSKVTYRTGFPLDDAWIHQTYARSLGVHGEWAFLPGQPSAGSTAPLWTALLSLGYLLRLQPTTWAYLLGALILWGLAALTDVTLRKWRSSYQANFPWAGCLIALEWHLVWSAVSGMESLLSGLLVMLVLTSLLFERPPWLLLGILIGLSVWVRPDGITLLGPVVLAAFVSRDPWKARIRRTAWIFLGWGSLFTLYLLLNLKLAGSIWPNTFYAKQAEYASTLQEPFILRLIQEPLQIITGVGILLLPGLIILLAGAVRQREWGSQAASAWMAGFVFLYAWRLPVTYQYGRYIMPVMPFFFLLGLAGMMDFLGKHKGKWQGVFSASWKLTTTLTLFIFWWIGARVYARDVAIIESEMVDTAHWVAENLPAEALIAAHDIGALGYYGKHDLVDLAGLISPEVIPFLGDESRLAVYLDERGAAYLVTFPGWYPGLTMDRQVMFSSGASYAPLLGEENMAVYRWQEP